MGYFFEPRLRWAGDSVTQRGIKSQVKQSPIIGGVREVIIVRDIARIVCVRALCVYLRSHSLRTRVSENQINVTILLAPLISSSVGEETYPTVGRENELLLVEPLILAPVQVFLDSGQLCLEGIILLFQIYHVKGQFLDFLEQL